jgi:hypothetical protein
MTVPMCSFCDIPLVQDDEEPDMYLCETCGTYVFILTYPTEF